MVEMQVMGLALEESAKAPILLLKATRNARILPIWVGAAEAVAISTALNSIPLPRPLTHDLLLNCIYSLGGKIHSVEISAISEGSYRAELVVDSPSGQLRIDSRPSDAIALALRAGKPINANEDVLTSAGTYHLRAIESGKAQFYGPTEMPELLATLFTLPDSPKFMETGENRTSQIPENGPRITVTVTPVRRDDEHADQTAPRVRKKMHGEPGLEQAKQTPEQLEQAREKSLEELLRALDPESKYRM